MNEFHGFLFSKLNWIGSKSEGPTYFLQQFDYSEIWIIKQTQGWEQDPALQKHLGTKATIVGTLLCEGLSYTEIKPYVPSRIAATESRLNVTLELETKELWLNKMPPSPPARPFRLVLRVEWPYRSIWRGLCPTSQIYDFWVERQGKTLWQWSKGKMFAQALTPVTIPGGSPREIIETWIINPQEIDAEGVYTIRALFIASGQEVEAQLSIKFAS